MPWVVVEMAEIVVEVPKEFESVVKKLGKGELNRVVSKALKEHASELLLFKIADEVLKKSRLTDELALELGDALKARVAKRHGL